MGEIIQFPGNRHESGESESQSKIESASSFEDLEQALYSIGRVKGSLEVYSAESLIDKINRVRNGELSIDYITRTHGLREKVTSLLEASTTKIVNQEEAHRPEVVQSNAADSYLEKLKDRAWVNENFALEDIRKNILVDEKVHELTKLFVRKFTKEKNARSYETLQLFELEDLLIQMRTREQFLDEFLPKLADESTHYVYVNEEVAKRVADIIYG